MRDWKREIRERLAGVDLPPDIEEEIIVELASHLEETYESARLQRFDDVAAVERTLQEVDDCRVLAQNIRRAKSRVNRMNHRTKSLWLPALATFLGASLSLMSCQFLGMKPRIVWVGQVAVWFYWPWLATLPIFGAVGALLSRRAQGLIGSRVVAGLAPALIMLTVMLLILPWGLAIDGVHFLQLVSFGLGVLNWVVIPAVALLLGALPFLRRSEPAEV